jgi:hypothetical protein
MTQLPGRGRNFRGGNVPFSDGRAHIANTVLGLPNTLRAKLRK